MPGLARANHLGPYKVTTPPLLPTRQPHISAGEQEFLRTEEWEAGEVGPAPGGKRVGIYAGYGLAAVSAGPGGISNNLPQDAGWGCSSA